MFQDPGQKQQFGKKLRSVHLLILESQTKKSVLDTYTQKERNPYITLKIVVKSQGEERKEKRKEH